MPARTVTITGLGDFRQLQAELERTGVISAQSNKSIADSAARAGEAAAAQAKEMGASADEQEAAAARAASAYVDSAEKMTQSQKAAAAAAAAAADASGASADEIVAASARAVEAQKAMRDASMETAAAADASGARLGTAFDEGTSKAGSALTRLGETGASWGIPFSGSLTKMGKQFDEAETKSGKFGSALYSVGALATVAGAALAAGVGVEAVKMGEQYESAQAKIQAATGMGTKSAKEMTSAFGQVGKFVMTSGEESETAFAGVAGQLQATEGHALGTAEAMKVMAAATNLNDAVQGNLTESTAALGAVMQAFHLSVGQAAATSDTLYNVSTRLDVPISSLSTAMDKLHAKLGSLSPTLSDMGGLMVSLGEHGITGSRGIQTVSSAMSTLVGGSEKTTKVLADLGVNIFNSQGKFIGMSGVIAQLGPKLAGLSQQQQIFAEKTLFGASAYQVMGSVLQSGVGAYQRATDAATKVGTAQQAAAKQAETLHGEFETAKASIETLGGDLGLILLPKLKELAKGLAEGITWLTKHKEAAIALGAIIGGPLAAAVTVYATTKAASFVKSTGEMAMSMWRFGAKVVEVVPQVIAKLTGQAAATEALKLREGAIYGEQDAVVQGSAAKQAASAKEIEGSIYGEAAAVKEAGAEIQTATGQMALDFEGVSTAAAGAETKVAAAVAGETLAVTTADGEIEAANVAVGTSFTALLLPIGFVAAAVVALKGPMEELLGKGEDLTQMAGKYGSFLNKAKEAAAKAGGYGNLSKAKGGVEAQGQSLIKGSGGGSSSTFEQGALRTSGLSKDAAAGIVAAYAAEGGTNTAEDPKEGAYGKAQWVGPRKEALAKFAAEKHEAVSSETAQLEFTAKEIKERGELGTLNAAKSPKEAADLFIKNFEEPENPAEVEARVNAPGSKMAGGTNSGLSALMNETSNSKAVKEAESEAKRAQEKAESKTERAQEKKESKAEEARKKEEEEAKKLLETNEKGNESLLKKYEMNIQSSTPAAIEKSLGISTTGKYESIPGLAEQAAKTGKTGPLEKELGKSAGASEAGKQEAKLVTGLMATHKAALMRLATEVVGAHRAALAALVSEMVSAERTTLGEQLKVQATEEKDRTTLAEHSAADQLNVVKASQAQQTDAMKAAATAIGDATQSMSDEFSALAQSIEDSTKIMSDASNQAVQEVKDKTTVEVGILGERGLYGLNLIAQKEEVQLDEMRASYDQQIAQAQREEAEKALGLQQLQALDEQHVDQDKSMADAQEASAQAHVDSVTVAQDQRIAAAQAEVDAAQLRADTLIGNAELKVLNATNAGKQKELEAASGLKYAEGEGAKTLVANAERHLKAEVEPAANTAINAASFELAKTVESWSRTIKEAEQNLTKAKGEGQRQLAEAQKSLTRLEGEAALAEEEKAKEIAVTKEKATTQYAGSGLVVNLYGLNSEDAAANASALGWQLRSLIPA